MLNQFFNFKSEHTSQFGYSLLFGISSMFFGFVQFNVPGVVGVASDFREVPLLISLFYLKHPIYIIIECLFIEINPLENGSFITSFVMHIIPLWLGMIFYLKVLQQISKHHLLALLWLGFTIIYYSVLVIPTMIMVDELFELTESADFLGKYSNIMYSLRFEMLSTSLISSIFLIQLRVKQSLEEHKKNLVMMVNNKTQALANANKELKAMNENLDLLVQERTQKVHEQFDQLLKYAHHNSHEVRAPLSRMQGLMSIILQEEDTQSKMDLIEKLKASSEELDAVIKQMNQILESEILKEKK